jgi:hypothetical protein
MKKAEPDPGPEAPTILFTGFPGFIGMRLLPRILEGQPEARLECLVQEKFVDAARGAVETYCSRSNCRPWPTNSRTFLVPSTLMRRPTSRATARS